jgi:phosphoribosylformylglycinamidine synthase II
MNETLYSLLGLTDLEYQSILDLLEREPNELELSMFSVMWSEHCSYKSSRAHLGQFPTSHPRVIVGPGENAGVIDAGHGIAVAFRIESHNHPSAIEPRQGAATGVGGILRDIFTMGARPIAVMDSLYMGPLNNARNRYIFENVVLGISSYGNSVGVPTLGGEIYFGKDYSENPLVNVFALGVMPRANLVFANAGKPGNVAVLMGASTGRDGIGGVSVLASSSFSSESDSVEKLPSVQVGDPFEEKRLMEACLELLNKKLVSGIQDLGGGGLTCAASETTAKAHLGIDLDLSKVPLRQENMKPYEIMISESQERMLAIIEPEKLDEVLNICKRWEIKASVVGNITDTGRLRVFKGPDQEILADIPPESLTKCAPLYQMASLKPEYETAQATINTADLKAALLNMLKDPSWIYSQYDHQLNLNTILGPSFDATVFYLSAPEIENNKVAAAVSLDANPDWCYTDPYSGSYLTVVESAINTAICGADPIALVNCLNFGDPNHPEVMWQFEESIKGISQACRDLNIAVVGGNVSFYNAKDGKDILPTPTIGMLALLEDPVLPESIGPQPNDYLILIGPKDPLSFSLNGSHLAKLPGNKSGQGPYEIREPLYKSLLTFLKSVSYLKGNPYEISFLTDISQGGLALASAEICSHYKLGLNIDIDLSLNELFCELPGRLLIATSSWQAVHDLSTMNDLECRKVGQFSGNRLKISQLIDIKLDELCLIRQKSIADYFK